MHDRQTGETLAAGLRSLRGTWEDEQHATYVHAWPSGRRVVSHFRVERQSPEEFRLRVLTREDQLDFSLLFAVVSAETLTQVEFLDGGISRGPCSATPLFGEHLTMIQNLANHCLRGQVRAQAESLTRPAENPFGLRRTLLFETDLSSFLGYRQEDFLTPSVPILGLLHQRNVSSPEGFMGQILDEAGQPEEIVAGKILSTVKLVSLGWGSARPESPLALSFSKRRLLTFPPCEVAIPRAWVPRPLTLSTDEFSPLFDSFWLYSVRGSYEFSWTLGVHTGGVREIEGRLEFLGTNLHSQGEITERKILSSPYDGVYVENVEPTEDGAIRYGRRVLVNHRSRRALAEMNFGITIRPDLPGKDKILDAIDRTLDEAVASLRLRV